MSAIKKYFKEQFQVRKFGLNCEFASDFYVSCFQKNVSSLPLLCLRGLLFLTCIAIVLTSFIMTAIYISAKHWPIYLTHWGLVLITLSCGFGFGISARVYFKGPIDSTFGLPWYVKAYWVLYTTSTPIAFFISLFYWAFLANAIEDFAVDIVLDVFIHAVNSVLMVILLLSARHPTNLLHFCFSLGLAIVYAIFTVIYYFAGGRDQFGNIWIYPVLDWSNPGPALVMIAFSAVLIIICHLMVALLTVARDSFARFCLKDTKTFRLSTE